MKPSITLTDQQTAVVQHNTGPALVFAVAGAGKTTAMVHRIERLVRERIFPPQRILATSFGRANVQDLRTALQAWPACRAVDGRTLHALGRDILLRAQRHGHLPHLKLSQNEFGPANIEYRLLEATLAEARKSNAPYKRELEVLDREDFLAYVGACKGNLLYARADYLQVPPQSAAGLAVAPPSPLNWYLDLYQLMEEVRRAHGWVTFNDMLQTGWEALVRFPEVLAEVQALYQAVLVDEYQDINLAQSEILHLLTEPHGNYMAIGDDDQTIYEWRGAQPEFILQFAGRYQATRYLISDNFRCPALPLVLANEVIAHNKRRAPKRLSLTRGFGGETQINFDADLEGMSRHIVARIKAMVKTGLPLNEMAVLVRLNAQTPYIEQQLITEKIPYRVSKPFYDRQEIRTLMEYGRLAWLERALQNKQNPLLNPATRDKFDEAWRSVCNRPNRYINRDLQEQMRQALLRHPRPLSQLLRDFCVGIPQEWMAERVAKFADDLVWLAGNLEQPAAKVLRELTTRLDYDDYLRKTSGFPQTAEGRVASVRAFVDYSREHGDLLTFMQSIRQLADQKIGQELAEDAVTLSTIHQAKGLEWTAVFIPQCNQEIMPFFTEREGHDRLADLEEERRLFYVALTRTKKFLYLHALRDQPISQFLNEAKWQALLPTLQKVQAILVREPQTWQAQDVLTIAQNVSQFHLQRFFELWEKPERAAKVAQRLQEFAVAVAANNLYALLKVSPEQLAWWQTLAPANGSASPEAFPGLEELLPWSGRTPKAAPAHW